MLREIVPASFGGCALVFLTLAACASCVFGQTHARGLPRLKVSPSGRHVVTEHGKPFFYLGDTAWELFHRLNREEADLYLEDRSRKHFTVIQAVVLAELDGLNTPNAYGHKPLTGNDPTRPATKDGPADDYWDHVDYIVRKAESVGLYVGMLPTWGDKWNKKWGVGPEIFNPDNARAYGRWLGERYKDAAVIWILGGDRSPESDQHLAIVRAMAEGIRQAVGKKQLMTFHPQGGATSSKWFHQDDWLDVNAFQSGHGALDNPNYKVTLAVRSLAPAKPVLDAEPRYEDHPVRWKAAEGWFNDFDVRQAAYWSMLAGAAGHTYGNHNIWQMWQPGRPRVSAARTPWTEALNHIGATQMGYLRQLFESRPWQQLEPDDSLIAGSAGRGGTALRAARAADGGFAFIYSPYGKPIEAALGRLGGEKLLAWWFDPRTGKPARIGEFPRRGTQAFAPPTSARGCDWLLVLDDTSRNFGPPGWLP